ncbi:MAG: L-selectin [Mediterranea massiliensis]|nr:L-selectin [Mediterranea massiliensis]
MNEKIKFSANVMLIDVAFLNEVAANAQVFLSERIGRKLPDIDLPTWLSYLALDAGLREGENEIQVLLIHEEATQRLLACQPAELKSLNGMACRTTIGEFIFSCVTPADITHCEDLFVDLMTLAIDSADVERLTLLPCHPQYGEKVESALRQIAEDRGGEACDKAIYFCMQSPAQSLPCRTDSVIFSLAQAFGIRPEEM